MKDYFCYILERNICVWSNERLICLEKISKQKSIEALAWLLLTTVNKIYNRKKHLIYVSVCMYVYVYVSVYISHAVVIIVA